jgi:hypothetical protein
VAWQDSRTSFNGLIFAIKAWPFQKNEWLITQFMALKADRPDHRKVIQGDFRMQGPLIRKRCAAYNDCNWAQSGHK